MTICIAALSDGRKSAVLASDKMITVDEPFNIQYEPRNSGKIDEIADGIFVLSAGSALEIIDLLNETQKELVQIHNPSVEEAVDEVLKAYRNLRKKRIEDLYLSPRGLNLESYYAKMKDFPDWLVTEIDRKFVTYDFDLTMLIIGKSDNNLYRIFEIEDPGSSVSLDSIGFATIGIGETHATARFTYNRYDFGFALKEGLRISYLAKKDAEMAPFVGRETIIRILTQKKSFNLTDDNIKILDSAYSSEGNISNELINNVIGDGDE